MTTALTDRIITDDGRIDLIGRWLDRKATSPESFAWYCDNKGARGEPKCPTSCIIVSLVERVFGIKVTATQFGIRIRNSTSNKSYTPSPVIAQFMTNFDKGMYPELIGEYKGDPFSGNTTH